MTVDDFGKGMIALVVGREHIFFLVVDELSGVSGKGMDEKDGCRDGKSWMDK